MGKLYLLDTQTPVRTKNDKKQANGTESVAGNFAVPSYAAPHQRRIHYIDYILISLAAVSFLLTLVVQFYMAANR
ncbi:MAG: hypothetical protein PHE26_09050 [Syntrophomonadaceae bacterium]|nr:hypothetical protein [Syntrophomonadaceae bacterium]